MKITFTLIAVLFYALLNAQDAGTLDSSFGMNGTVITTFNNDYALCFGATLQNDNKIITVGQGNKKVGNQIIAGFLLVRYNSNGIPDNTFGDNGRIITAFDSGLGEAHGVAVQTDNKIVVVGLGGIDGSLSNNDIFLVRYNSDGNIDSGFGTYGKVRTDFGLNENGLNVAIQNDNKIIVCGYSLSNFLVARYFPNGSLDTSFGTNGAVRTTFTGGIAKAFSVVVQKDGKILTAGTAGNKAALARYLSNGSLDTEFGNAGTLTSTFNSSYSSINSIAIKSDGSFIVAGEAGTGFSGDMLVAKYQNNGNPDQQFGENGSTLIHYEKADSRAKSVALQPDEKIIIIGDTYSSFNSDNGNFALCRLLNDGTVDESFGTSGKTVTDFENRYNESAACGFLDNQQRIVVAGYPNNFSSPAGYAILLARYNNDDLTKKQTIIKKIKRYIQTHSDAQATTLKTVSIYPNPAKNVLQISGLSSSEKTKITVVDLAGNVAISQQLSANSPSYNLNIATLKPGNYMLRIETNREVVTKQFVKE